MLISIVIPNWNGVYLLKKHLQRVLLAGTRSEIIVVDDSSTDGSVAYLTANFPSVIVVQQKKQEGFAAAVNAGVARAGGDVVILLNTDVEPERNFLAPLVAHFVDPDVFAVGSLEQSIEGEKTILRGRGIGRWEKGYYIHSRGEVDRITTAWVSGGSGAFRKSMWEKLGGMDTLYNPFYWEDIDLSYRARKAGWKTLFEPKSIVRHYHESGKIKQEFSPSDVKRIAYRNQFIFIWKNLTDIDIMASHILITPVRMFQALLRGDFMMIRGFCDALGRLPGIVNYRTRHTSLNKPDKSLALWQ